MGKVFAARGSSSMKGQQLTFCAPRTRPVAAGALKIEAARTAENKKDVVSGLKESFDSSLLVAAVNFQGLSVTQVKQLRRSLPSDAKLVMVKNTLARKACEDSTHSEIGACLQGPNALLFVEENIAEGLKAVSALKKELGEKISDECLTYTGGSMEGKAFTGEDLKKLEKLPSKQELIAKIAGAIKAVPRKVAYGVKAVPNKVGYAAQAYKDKLEGEQ